MDYTKETVPSLKQMCKERKIRRYSKKTKTELIDVLRHYDENGHTKNYRKVVVAKFTPHHNVFQIPDGIDLYDKTVVENYFVLGDTLRIFYADGRKENIDADFKERIADIEKVSVEDAEDWRRYSKKNQHPPIDYDENGHTKNYRKVVVAKFTPTYTVFKIPDGIDLYDKTVVRNWSVLCDTLHIWYADGREEKIDVDFRQKTIYLEKVSVEDAEDWPVKYDKDEEDEDKE